MPSASRPCTASFCLTDSPSGRLRTALIKSSRNPSAPKPSAKSSAGSIRLQRVFAGENTSAAAHSARRIMMPPMMGVPVFLLWVVRP